jgi:CcmD family protein
VSCVTGFYVCNGSAFLENNLPSLALVRMRFKRAFCFLVSLTGILISTIHAQSANDDFFRSTGKIYVVVAGLLVIFLLIVAYLIWLDLRIKNLENKLPNGKN